MTRKQFKPNPNSNCLAGKRCPTCGNHESLEVETLGVIEGTTRVSRFWTRVTDDGTENPVTVGDTEEPDDGYTICPECGHEGPNAEFDDGDRS